MCIRDRGLGGSWGLLGLKRPEELILIDFWYIFDRFWLIFGGFLNDFSMISVMVVTRVWYRRSSWMFLIFFCMSAFAWFSNDSCDGCHLCLIPQRIMNVLISVCQLLLFYWKKNMSCWFQEACFYVCFLVTHAWHCFSRHLGCRSFQPLCQEQNRQCSLRRAARSGRLYQQQVARPAGRRGVFQNEKCIVTWAQICMRFLSHVNFCLMLDIVFFKYVGFYDVHL